MLTSLVPENQSQIHMFETHQAYVEKQKKLASIVDKLNIKYGGGSLRYAAEGIEKKWYMRSSQRSPAYTTMWKDLRTIK